MMAWTRENANARHGRLTAVLCPKLLVHTCVSRAHHDNVVVTHTDVRLMRDANQVRSRREL